MTTINSYRVQSYHQHRDQHGQSAVEMALLLPVILLLLFGIIMAGFIFFAYIQVTNAAREGARAGSVYNMTKVSTGWTLDTTVKKAIFDDKGTVSPSDDVSALGYLSTSLPSFDVDTYVTTSYVVVPSNIGIPGRICGASTPCAGDQLTVQVAYSYTVPIISVMLPMFPQPIVFSPQVTMELQ